MPWFKVDDNLLTHPKFMGLSDGSVALWLRAGVWSASALTNGEVPRHALRMLAERGDESAEELVARGLWERSKVGYRFHDWNDYQPSPEHIEEVRRVRREAGRQGGLARSIKQIANQIDNQISSSALANQKQTPTPYPNPSPKSQKNSMSTAAPRDDVERLCKHLADLIEKNGSRRPEVTNGWRNAARLLLDRDKRTEAQVMRAIDWCQQDDFWHRTVLSMPTLRKQYDRLRLAAQKPVERGQPAPLRPYNDRLGQKQADLDARLAAENEAARAELGDIEIGRAV